MAKQISTQYVVKHKGVAKRITVVEETNGVARGRFANVKDLKKPTAAAYTVERFLNEALIGLDNIEHLVEQTHMIFGIGKPVAEGPTDYDEHLRVANIVYQGHEKDGALGALESHEEDMVLAELARNRRLYGEHMDISMHVRNRH